MPSDGEKKDFRSTGNRMGKSVSGRPSARQQGANASGKKYESADEELGEVLESIDNYKKELNKKDKSELSDNEEIDKVDFEEDFDYDISFDFADEDYYADYDDEDDEDEGEGFFGSLTKGRMAVMSGVFAALVLIIMVFIAAFARKEVQGSSSGNSGLAGNSVTKKATPVVNKNDKGENVSASLNVTLVPGYVRPDGNSGNSGGGSGAGSGGGSEDYKKPTKAPVETSTPTPYENDNTPSPTEEIEDTETPSPEISEGGETPVPTEDETPSPEISEGGSTSPTEESTPTPDEGQNTATPTDSASTPDAGSTDTPVAGEPTVLPDTGNAQ